jgi:hypothetical protein
MPPVSQAQRKAMYAAAAGDSTLGIPKAVGQDFTAADKPGKLPAKAPGPARKSDADRMTGRYGSKKR